MKGSLLALNSQITDTINTLLADSIFPDSWKEATVITNSKTRSSYTSQHLQAHITITFTRKTLRKNINIALQFKLSYIYLFFIVSTRNHTFLRYLHTGLPESARREIYSVFDFKVRTTGILKFELRTGYILSRRHVNKNNTVQYRSSSILYNFKRCM